MSRERGRTRRRRKTMIDLETQILTKSDIVKDRKRRQGEREEEQEQEGTE